MLGVDEPSTPAGLFRRLATRQEPQSAVKGAIVVLGSSTNPSSPIMQARVAHGVELLRRGVAPYLVMSGGCSFRLEQPPLRTEAEVMCAHAMSLGVPRDRIVLEGESADTLGNAYFTKVRVLETRGWRNLALVTSETHAFRAQWLFEKVLGRDYRLEVVSVDTAASHRDRELELESSDRLLLQAQERLAGIADGDHEALRRFVPLPAVRARASAVSPVG